MAQMREMMYEGKAKQVFATDDPTLAIIHYKDDATAFNGLKKGTIVGKGVINNVVSNHLMTLLKEHGVESHLVEQLSERDTLVRRVQIVPIEVIVRVIRDFDAIAHTFPSASAATRFLPAHGPLQCPPRPP